MYFLEGPINNSSNIYIVFSYDNDNYLLVYYQGKYYVSDQVVTNKGVFPGQLYIPTFNIEVISYPDITSSNPISYRLKDTVLFYLSYTTEKGLFSSKDKTSENTCLSNQDQYQEWRPPCAFLAGAQYSLLINDLSPVIPIYGTKKTLNVSDAKMFIVPVKWFQQGFCSTTATGDQALTYNYCYITGNNEEKCSNVPNGWTLNNECQLSLTYNYCPSGVYCSASCKAPCNKKSNECQWNVNNDSFQCNKVFNWWTSWWFLTILIFTIILIILICIIIPFFRRKEIIKDGYKEI